MTFQQIVRRIKQLTLAHKQIKSFHRGYVADRLNDKDTVYATAILQDLGGSANLVGSDAVFNFRMVFLDLVHVASDTKDNELDVQSDMVSVALDILSQMGHDSYSDWRLSPSNSLQLIYEGDDSEGNGDMYAGCAMDFTVRVPFPRNVCQVPTTISYQ